MSPNEEKALTHGPDVPMDLTISKEVFQKLHLCYTQWFFLFCCHCEFCIFGLHANLFMSKASVALERGKNSLVAAISLSIKQSNCLNLEQPECFSELFKVRQCLFPLIVENMGCRLKDWSCTALIANMALSSRDRRQESEIRVVTSENQSMKKVQNTH